MRRLDSPSEGLSASHLISRRTFLRLAAALGISWVAAGLANDRRALASAQLGLGCMLRKDTIELNLRYAGYTPGIVWASSRSLPAQYYPALSQKGRFLAATSLEWLTRHAQAGQTLEYDGLAYNPERGVTPPEETADLPAATAQARAIADQYGKLLMAGPGAGLMAEHPEWYSQVAALCDIYYMQTAAYQDLGIPGYFDAVAAIVGQLLGREAWAQLVTKGPDRYPAEVLVEYARAIAPLVRGITVLDYLDPTAPQTLTKVFRIIAGPGIGPLSGTRNADRVSRANMTRE